MQLPADYQQIITNGATVLRALGARARAHAERNPAVPELWLAVRDIEGLAGRMGELDALPREEIFVTIVLDGFTGQDLGVLDDLLLGDGLAAAVQVDGLTELESTALRLTHELLRDYTTGKDH